MSTQVERFEEYGDGLKRTWTLLDCFECCGRGWVAKVFRIAVVAIANTTCRRCGGSGKEASAA